MSLRRRSSRPPAALTSGTAATLILVLASALGGAPAAAGSRTPDVVPPGGDYVALGDSFSAGTGTRAPTDSCYRSPFGYPALLAAAQGLVLDYQACSGATTAQVRTDQLGALDAGTDYVTLTIGGNDVGFTDVVVECALPGWLSDCRGEIDDARAVLHGPLPGRYDALLAEIGTRAPAATVVVGGYPHLFNGEDCHLLTFFTRSEMTRLNAATDELDGVVQARTLSAGFDYVDPRAAFEDHATCDDTEWVNGLSWPLVESYHPNRAGNVAYAEVFWPGATAAASTSDGSGAAADPGPRPDRDAQVREQARAVLGMDLTSPAHLRAAQAGGVPTGDLVRLERALRSGDVTQMSAALEGLQRLDQRHEARAGR